MINITLRFKSSNIKIHFYSNIKLFLLLSHKKCRTLHKRQKYLKSDSESYTRIQNGSNLFSKLFISIGNTKYYFFLGVIYRSWVIKLRPFYWWRSFWNLDWFWLFYCFFGWSYNRDVWGEVRLLLCFEIFLTWHLVFFLSRFSYSALGHGVLNKL